MILQTSSPSSSEKLQALTIHAELTAVFEQRYGGSQDTEALQSVQSLCNSLSWGVMTEKVHTIAAWATILYSDHKHAKWGANGVERVRSFIWDDMSSLERAICRME